MTAAPARLHAAAPAKINLFLHITGRRPDGYHLLESLFCPISLHDDVQLELFPNFTGLLIEREGPLAALSESVDLTARAVRAFFKAAGIAAQWRVVLKVTKRIPEQAGLGGGSSDAATVLKLLQSHFGNPLSPSALADTALTLGADVPFFLNGQAAFVEGIGEQITPLGVPAMWLLVYKPPQSCPTGKIFSDTELTRNATSVKMAVFDSRHSIGNGLWQYLNSSTRNVMQAVVEKQLPEWQQQFAAFSQTCANAGSLLVRMSGSGSAMFAVFESADSATQAEQAVTTQKGSLTGQLFVCQTISSG